MSPIRRDSGITTGADDKFVRKHVKVPRTGILHIFKRAENYQKSSPVAHINDLRKIIEPEIARTGIKGSAPGNRQRQ
jgi:hypothetical protein